MPPRKRTTPLASADTPQALPVSKSSASVVVIDLPPDAHGAPVMASVVVFTSDGCRYVAALMHNERVARLRADIDELGEALIAANLAVSSPHAHWFLFPVQGTGGTAAEAVDNLRARVSPMLASRARTDGGAMRLLADSFQADSWTEGL